MKTMTAPGSRSLRISAVLPRQKDVQKIEIEALPGGEKTVGVLKGNDLSPGSAHAEKRFRDADHLVPLPLIIITYGYSEHKHLPGSNLSQDIKFPLFRQVRPSPPRPGAEAFFPAAGRCRICPFFALLTEYISPGFFYTEYE